MIETRYIGYVRVSTVEQNEARQLKALDDFGKPMHRIFVDKCSGKNTDRPQFQEMLAFVQAGDVIVVSEYSRFARSTVDLLQTVDKLQKMGVSVISLKEQLDTTTKMGKFMLTILASVAELERETILERQHEGIEIAKAQGKYKGRKAREIDVDVFRHECELWRAGKQTAQETAEKTGYKRAMFYRKVKELGL